jgi:DNA helicase IV
VLPSLGETGVVLSTVGELYPGVTGVPEADPAVVALKGDLRLARVLDRSVRLRQRLPDGPRTLAVGRSRLTLTPDDVRAARARARRSRKPHNRAREGFLRDLLDLLAGRLAAELGTTLADHREDLLEDLRDSPDVRRELNLAWLPLTAEQVLADLFADPDRLVVAAGSDLTAAEQRLLRRDRGEPWTVADVPLLDELAELLGPVAAVDHAAEAAARARRAEDLANAREALRHLDTAIRPTAEQIADRFAESGPALTVAERAESDRTWAYGHLVVDEAQELSPMTWRLLMRRCPTRSMTLVGDVAQVGSEAGTSSWAKVLDPYVRDRWRLEELTVNYRTPTAIMQVASDVLAGAGVTAPTPRSVRDGEFPPVVELIPAGLDVAEPTALDEVRRVVGEQVRQLGTGRLAVVAPADLVPVLHAHLAAALPTGTVGSGRTALDSPVVVLGVADVKGLEFDSVVVVEPNSILKASPRGANDLYVALTRPTQRLHVLASGDLPVGLAGLGGAV